MRSASFDFEPYFWRWHLVPDGDAFATHSSHLIPVRYKGLLAMLKVEIDGEEKRGAGLMVWWQGQGAARVLAHEGDALLLERIEGGRSLGEMARRGRDDEASRILCDVAAKLHTPCSYLPPDLVPLERWFEELDLAAAKYVVLREAARIARELLAAPQEVTILHGDLHHANVLDAGPRGWLAIDPKGLLGERGFDFANIFCNPDEEYALTPGRLARQASVVAERAHLDRTRLLKWIAAYSGLSAAWWLSDGGEPVSTLTITRNAIAELQKTLAI